MMTNQEFRTLAYKKSPKTSKRTTFQDELQAAVSARASKTPTSYSDDFNEDEDDFLNDLIKSRKKKTGPFKSGKSKTKINDFDLSDDESKHERTKKVSFLKSQRVRSPAGDALESHENEPPDSTIDGVNNNNNNNSLSSHHSSNASGDDTEFKNSAEESANPHITRENSNKSLSQQSSGDTPLDTTLPLPSDSSVTETPGPEERSSPGLEEGYQSPHLSASDPQLVPSESATEREPPRPKPRQRTLGLSHHASEKPPEETESQDLSRPQTSSTSIPFSTGTSGNTAEVSLLDELRSCSPHWTEGDPALSYSLSKSSSKSEWSQLLTKSRTDSGSRDDSKEQERKFSTSLEDICGDHSDQSVVKLSHTQEKSFDTRTSSSHSKATPRSQSACSRKVESKYLGTLKVLDRKVSLQEPQPQAADSLRAAIYQEWLKKKQEKSRENMRLKKKEELLKEQKKRAEEVKREEATASYEAWKEKKAEILKAKAKEKQDIIRKEQKASEEKEEKRESAKQVFEKWKVDHDHLLKEKDRKQKEAENKQKLKKQEKEEERKIECKSAFSHWCEKKKDIFQEKIATERNEFKNKAEEEQYMKEERDKMALEMYENWLARKDLEQRRQREERRIKAILRDSPPPPWSPPNKTIPFRK